MRILGAAIAAVFVTSAPGFADGLISEVRLGVAAHDLTDHSEDGPQITGELLLQPIEQLGFIGAPKPVFNISISTQGFTNLAGAGLLWDGRVGENWRIEGGFGLAVHDGINDLDTTLPPLEQVRIKETRALLGSDVLFRTTFGLNYDVTERWGVGLFYEHYSHGQILGDGRNQGLDELGVRLNWRFGD
ncbi:MAG: acyloxyacyl hydrolase [Oceanicaulis sp.]